ncbi:MAG: hypothetical protein M0R46_13275 [Candidatus Muirbacterium halophilum]|nr:hypothetical protein [Candidatus Muirbacterium halophilum]
MRLSTLSSSFIYNFPSNFLPMEILRTYTPILEKNWIQYENVVDYLNSTIKSVNFPGISFDIPKQTLMRGKERMYKPAKNNQDIVTTHELHITFRSVDSDLNYWILFDILQKHYLDVENSFVEPLTVTCVDIHRDAIYIIRFYEIILKGLSDNIFDYSIQKINPKEFTLTVHFNFYDIEFLLDKSKVLEVEKNPVIIQKI